MRFKKKPVALATTMALSIAYHCSATAQTKPEAPQVLNEIVINAAKIEDTPAATGIGKTTLDAMRPATSDTASLLRDIPGMSLYGAGGVSSLPAIHGLADDRVRTKVDGMDLISACANHMNSPLSYIDPTSVSNVKVFAGITPVSLGGDSIGGAIIVNSAEPEFARAGENLLMKGQAGAFYRSNGNAYGANVSATLAGEKLSLTYTGATAESDNYKAARSFKPAGPAATGRNWLAGDEVGSSAYKSQNQSISVALKHENHLLDFKVGYQHIPYQGFPNQRMDMTENTSTQYNLRYRGSFDWGKLESRVYHERTRHSMNFGDDKLYWYGTPATIPGMPMETEGKNSGALLKADVILNERDILRIGGELQQYRLDDWWPPSGGGMWPNTLWNIRDGQRDRYDVFGEWEANWNPQWSSLLGVRSSTVKMDAGNIQGYNTGATYLADATAFNARGRARTDNNIDLTALARFTPDTNQTYEAGYAQKTRSPNLYERYSWSTGGMAMRMVNMAGDGNGYVGNLDLKPEVAHTLSATANWHDATKEHWGLQITPFFTYVQDYTDARRCTATNCVGAMSNPNNRFATTGFVYLQFANQDARLYGLDVSGFAPIAKNTGVGSFIAKGLLNYVDGKNKTTGDNLYNIMPLNAKLAIEHRLGNWTNVIEGQMVAAKKDTSQVRNELKTGGYSLLNLRSSYEWKQVRFDVGVENALNKQYALPLGGAYVGQGTTMSATGVPYGVSVPGMGRSFYTGLNIKF